MLSETGRKRFLATACCASTCNHSHMTYVTQDIQRIQHTEEITLPDVAYDKLCLLQAPPDPGWTTPAGFTHSDRSVVFSTHNRPPDIRIGFAAPRESSLGRAHPAPTIGSGSDHETPLSEETDAA